MNLDFSDEQNELKHKLRQLLQSRAASAGPRSALEGCATYDAPLWRELGELGWLSVAIPEAYGGQGQGHKTLAGVAEDMGRSLAAVPTVSSIYVVAEANRSVR